MAGQPQQPSIHQLLGVKFWSLEEISIIKNTFAENEKLFVALRKYFLQIELTESEEVLLKESMSEDVISTLRKAFLPVLNGEEVLQDLWMLLDIENLLPMDSLTVIKAHQKIEQYTEQRMRELENIDIENDLINLAGLIPPADIDNEDFSPAEIHINLIARKGIVTHVILAVNKLRYVAGQKNETKEEADRRLYQNSTE